MKDLTFLFGFFTMLAGMFFVSAIVTIFSGFLTVGAITFWLFINIFISGYIFRFCFGCLRLAYKDLQKEEEEETK